MRYIYISFTCGSLTARLFVRHLPGFLASRRTRLRMTRQPSSGVYFVTYSLNGATPLHGLHYRHSYQLPMR